MTTASPWDALLRHAARRTAVAVEQPEKPPTKTAQLLQIIEARGRVPTLTLCVELDLPSMSVWGLLKVARQTGRVEFDGSHWSLRHDYVPPAVRKAAELLRAHGWTVEGPSHG